jgi:hypothetical protein
MPSLAINKDIAADDIMSVSDLKEGKIFMLTGKDGSQLVLKAESQVTGSRIKQAAPVVKAIDPSVKMKPLKPSEVSQLQQWLGQAAPVSQQIANTAGTRNAPSLTTAQKDSINNLKAAVIKFGTAVDGRTSIAKMNSVQMSTLKVVLDLDSTPTDSDLLTEAEVTYSAFTKALNEKGGLEMVGEILAGDWCIGNCDRFVVPKFTGKGRRQGLALQLYDAQGKAITGATGTPQYHDLNMILNVGNIILIDDNGHARLSMLDYMDPFSGFATETKKTDLTRAMEVWPMQHLLVPNTRTSVAQFLAEDLAYLLHPLNSGSVHSWKRNVGGRSAYKRIDAGIVSGIKKIIHSMESRKKQGKLDPLGAYLLGKLKEAKL